MEAPNFRYEVESGIALITFDQRDEPVNTLSPETGDELDALLERARKDEAVRGCVFVSGKKDNFIAGAKIEVLSTVKSASEATRLARRGQEGFNRLDHFPKPTIAAINGACLGGGLELALACDYRIATDGAKTSLGFPEVQLGLIPGAGGTQRLPQLIGAQAALDLILTGRTVKSQKARRLGIVDEVVPAPILLDVAKQRAAELAEGKLHPVRRHSHGSRGISKGKGLAEILKGLANKEVWAEFALEDNPFGRKILFDQARKQVLKKSRGKYPAPEKALDAIRAGLEGGMEQGLRVEAEAFGELVVSETSHRLVEIFFATTALKKENGTNNPKVTPKPIRKICVLGGGLMGGGIAYVTIANMGIPARVKDKDDAGVGRALKQIHQLFDERVARKSLSWREAQSRLAILSTTTDYSGFRNADLVIEAVFEDLALKQSVIRETEAAIKEQCIFASNTSSLPITKLSESAKIPERLVGMHYFSPVHKMPLIEIVTHSKTADWVTATCVDIGRKQGKTVIVVNDGVGFYTSRILAPYMNEAAYLLAEGADITELDRALVDFGFPVGPISLLDDVGIDVAEKVGKIMHEAFGDRMAAPDLLPTITADGRLGRKTKKGFYRYEGKKKTVDDAIYAMLPHGKHRKQLDSQEMADRCSLQFVNEAIRCLGENILHNPRDGDVGAIFGLGFPAFLGGPFRYVDSKGPRQILAKMEFWQQKFGKRFEPAPTLREMARGNKRFYPV